MNIFEEESAITERCPIEGCEKLCLQGSIAQHLADVHDVYLHLRDWLPMPGDDVQEPEDPFLIFR